MMKVLLCTPYLDTPDVIPGGIAMWARNILNYCRTLDGDLEVTPVSYDRRYNVSSKYTVLTRFHYGVKDYFSSIRETRSLLKSGQFGVLHLCTSAQLSLYKDLLIMKMARHYGAKAVVHFHFGRIPELLQQRNWECRILMKVCRAADNVIVMDQRSRDALAKSGLKNVSYLPNPLSLDIIHKVEELDGKVERIPTKLVFVGHVIKSKGVIELVEAVKQLDGVELHIIGLGGEGTKIEIKRIVSDKGNGQWLKLRGPLPHDEVLRELMSASVFAFPSYTEGFPNVILEAMACGCPIVSTTVGAIPEMLDIKNGSNCGICVPPRQMQPFADALKLILSDQEYASRCAENARRRVNEMYAVPIVWEQLSNIWRNPAIGDRKLL